MNRIERITRGAFDDAVQFEKRELGDNTIVMSATFSCHAYITVNKALLLQDVHVETHARQHLVECLLRKLYDFDRQELMAAIVKLETTNPHDFGAMNKGIEDVLIAAQRQAPK